MRTRWISRALAPVVIAAFALSSASCAIFETPNVTDVISGVQSLSGVAGSFVDGGAPKGAGPGNEATAIGAAIPGGSTPIRLVTAPQAREVAVFIEGLGGYYLLTLGSSSDTLTIVVTLDQRLPDTAITVSYTVADGGEFGAASMTRLQPLSVGTGEVQVSVTWDDSSDVDLHVVDPNGDEIYFGDAQSPSGGKLDLDSNAACGIDGKNQENITWSSAPRGEYIVRVDYWSSCMVPETNYVVTVQIVGRAPQIFSGQFTGTGDAGGLGAGVEITRFTF